MKSPRSSYNAICFFLFVFIANVSFGSVRNFDSAKLLAQQSDKHIFVNYTAGWCLPCQIFKEQVLEHNKVASFLESNFVILDVDFDDGVTKHLYKDFDVCCLPTLHVVNEDGALLGSVSNTINAEQFLQQIERYALTKLTVEKAPRKTIHKSRVETKVPKETTEYYTLQVGAFSNQNNAILLKSRLEKLLSDPVFLIEDKKRKLFILVVGQYSLKENLKLPSSILKEKGIDHFIKSKTMIGIR